MTTVLDVVGVALIVAAAAVIAGLGAALAVAGVSALVASWALERPQAQAGDRP